MTPAQRATLLATSAATGMLLLDVTVVYVALPAIQADLDASFAAMQWVIDAYTVALAATLLAAGVLADRHGRRGWFVGGIVVFSASSLVCGMAGSALTLDLARAVQGLGAAAMFATSLALLSQEFPGLERGRAMGIWGGVTGLALAVGPLVGGLVVDGLDWRWIFLLNVPIGVALVLLAPARVPDSTGERARRLDVGGLVAFAAAALLLVLGLIRGNEDGWGSAAVVGALLGAAAAAVAFVVLERRAADPILPPSLFRRPAFAGTAIVSFGQSVVIYPLLLFIAIYFQQTLGLSPGESGLRMLPMTVAILVVAPVVGSLTGRVPLRVPLGAGLVLFGLAAVLMHGVAAGDRWTAVLPEMVMAGIAVGLISPALASAMVAVLPVASSGRASGINNTFRQLGIAVGIAGLGAIFDARSGVVDGLNAVLAVAAAVAFVAALAGWLLLGRTDVEHGVSSA